MSAAHWMRYWIKVVIDFFTFAFRFKRWVPFLVDNQKHEKGIRAFFGYYQLPQAHEHIGGGLVKFQRLNQFISGSCRDFNILYLGSSTLPPNWRQILWLAGRRRAKIVLNQNGVMYPKHGPGWRVINHPLKQLVANADYVFYQSQFCKHCADKFLVRRTQNLEVLYNCVDTTAFKPATGHKKTTGKITLLLGGNQYEWYRFKVALQTLVELVRRVDFKVNLLITGDLSWWKNKTKAVAQAWALARDYKVQDLLCFTGPYNQEQAPAIYNQAHLLLHTKHNDPCPGVVVEALACGLPVVATDSGGLPELVGKDAGKCIPVEKGWVHEIRPDAEMMATAVAEVVEDLETYSEAARQRAVDHFDIKPWVQRHREVFNQLANGGIGKRY